MSDIETVMFDIATVDMSKAPTAYCYDDDGIFTHSEAFSLDPLESEMAGEPVWLQPGMSLCIAPGEITEGLVWRVAGDAWEEVEDHRGAEGFVNGQPHEVKELGPLPDGWSDTPPPTPEELAQAEYETALSESSAILTARSFRQMAQAEEFTATEFAVFAKAGLFPAWVPGESYEAGKRIAHEGIVYEVKQPVTAQEHQPPGSAGMLSVYRPISADPQSDDEPDPLLEILSGRSVKID